MEDEVEYAKRRSKRNRKRCIIGLSIILLLLLIIAIVVVIVVVVLPLFREPEESGEFRLPTSLTPDQYVLEFQPYLYPGNFTFDGKANITVTCNSSTNNVTLHSSGLAIHEATVREVTSGSNPGVKKIEFVPKYELLILHLKDDLRSNKMYQLHFRFSGTLGTSEGFYWRSYVDEHANEKYIAATKFKPAFARRAFPCFDEPSFKATFAITIIRENHLSSISSRGNKKNKLRQPRGDGWTADIYQSTIKMSPYLLGFFVGEYVGIRIEKQNVSVVARGQSILYAEHAMTAAQNASEFYSSKLRLPLSMPDIDLVAIPDEANDDEKVPSAFGALGEESTAWRLIMMDESSMLCRPQDKEWLKQDIALRVAHQIAHQPFGILVTPTWWNGHWLTESVATYLAMQAADHKINPKWKTLDALKRSSDYIEFDCSESSRPLSMAIDEPSDIFKPFNHALYKKGARLLDMAHGLMKKESFWEGLSKFVKKTFIVVEVDSFWRDLTETQQNGNGKIDFEAVMKSWVQNRGHPIVTLQRDYVRNTSLLTQQSCLNESTIWQIPIPYNHKGASTEEDAKIIWLNSTNKTLLSAPNKNRWVLLNGHLNGFFHVNYDIVNWKMLAMQLQDDHKVFSPQTRYQLLYDALFLAKMNFTTYDVMLDLLSYMRFELDINVKEFLAEAKLSEMWKMLRMSNVYSKWKDYVLQVMGTSYRELFDVESQTSELELLPKFRLKREVATIACYHDKRVCMDDAITKSKGWLRETEHFKEISVIDSFLLRPYLCTAVRIDTNIGDAVNTYLKNETHAYLQNKTVAKDLMYSLGCSNAIHRSSVYMERYIIEENVDPAPLIESMLNSHNGSETLFHFLMHNINRLKKKYNRLELVVKRLSEAIGNPKELKKMKEVFNTFIDKMDEEEKDKQETKRITKMLDSYVNMATKRLEFVKYQLPFMVRWLKK